MKRFIVKVLFGCLGAMVVSATLYSMLAIKKNPGLMALEQHSLFLFGDSQLLHALSPDFLSQQTGKQVFSVVRPGSGMYNLMTFSSLIPDSSVVLVGFSPFSMLIKRDHPNRGILYPPALVTMISLGYPVSDIKTLVEDNLRPHPFLPFRFVPVRYRPEPLLTLPVTLRKSLEISDSTTEKLNAGLFKSAIRNLLERNCHVLWVDFPVNPSFWGTVDSTMIPTRLRQLEHFLKNELPSTSTAFYTIESDSNLFYDYTHVNEVGQRLINPILASEIQSADTTRLRSIRFLASR